MRLFFFVIWDNDVFFYENDEPMKMYGPYDDLVEATRGLDELLRGRLVDYWELPIIVITEGSTSWN